MAEAVLLDGQALDPTSFGEFDEDSGIWKPIDVSGLTFGTNGFYLDFENSGSLGADVSGNGNNFTVNNLTSIDQTTDTPTNNFATLNPLNSVVVTNGSGVESSYGDTYGNGDIIGIALNMDDNEITFYKNGTAQNSGTAISIPTPDGACFLNIVNGADTSDTFKINFGNAPYTISSGNSDGNSIGNFEYAVPSGYLSLCTKNLATDG
jgi:hypothetical protein